jgi:hypothetical protein
MTRETEMKQVKVKKDGNTWTVSMNSSKRLIVLEAEDDVRRLMSFLTPTQAATLAYALLDAVDEAKRNNLG